MPNLLIALVVVVGGYWLLRKFARAQPAQVSKLMRQTAGGAVMAVAAFIGMRGAFSYAVPLFLVGLGLFGGSSAWMRGFPWANKSPGQRSRVATSILAMELDHDTGTMEGEVLQGPYQGRKLSSLSFEELSSFHSQCAALRDQSQALLEAWLDRNRDGWRSDWTGSPPPKQSASQMSREEAYAVLGLKSGATADEIRAAHRRLMKEFHPDRGGSDYLAAKINLAKDILLQD
jgi:hypothetical protein